MLTINANVVQSSHNLIPFISFKHNIDRCLIQLIPLVYVSSLNAQISMHLVIYIHIL